MNDIDGTSKLSKIIFIEKIDNKKRLKVYPNPTSNVLTIVQEAAFDAPSKGKFIQIINALGQIVFTQNSAASRLDIDVTDWANGIYFVKTTGEAVRFVKN